VGVIVAAAVFSHDDDDDTTIIVIQPVLPNTAAVGEEQLQPVAAVPRSDMDNGLLTS
jgi:hypothetical protein